MEESRVSDRRQRVGTLTAKMLPFGSHIRHSFKLLPSIGKHVVELLEGTISEELKHAWRWRPGGDALKSRRAAPAKDLADMPGWYHESALDTTLNHISRGLAEVKIRAQL